MDLLATSSTTLRMGLLMLSRFLLTTSAEPALLVYTGLSTAHRQQPSLNAKTGRTREQSAKLSVDTLPSQRTHCTLSQGSAILKLSTQPRLTLLRLAKLMLMQLTALRWTPHAALVNRLFDDARAFPDGLVTL